MQLAQAIAYLPDSGLVIVGASSFLHVIDPTGTLPPLRFSNDQRVITAVAALPDGSGMLLGGKPVGTSGSVEVRDPAGGLRTAFDLGIGGVFALAVSPDGATCAVAGEDGLAVGDADLFGG